MVSSSSLPSPLTHARASMTNNMVLSMFLAKSAKLTIFVFVLHLFAARVLTFLFHRIIYRDRALGTLLDMLSSIRFLCSIPASV